MRHEAYWSFNLYPQAGEGGGCFVPTLRPRPVNTGPAADPERSQQEAARRARGKLRRYCAANRLNRFATLTYAGEGCFDPVQLRADVAEFFRGLRRELGAKPLPYAWAPEWHPGGHGLHVHFTVGRYVKQRLTSFRLISALNFRDGRAPQASFPNAGPVEPRVSHEPPDSLASGLGVNSFQCPSETTSTVPSVTLMAV